MNNLSNSINLASLLPVLDGISDAAFIDDRNGICLWCNSACEEFYVVDREELFGKTVDQLQELGIFSQSVTKIVLEKKHETTIIHENKEGRKLLTSGYPIYNEDNTIQYVITTSRDITRLTDTESHLENIDNKLLDVNAIEQLEVQNSPMVAASQSMQSALTLARRLSLVDSPVLITGESGVGKGLMARILHDNGKRSEGPFVRVNCGAIPEPFMEAELFGYVRGTFTGTRAEGKVGLIESANGGTIFFDDITELPMNIQVKLLKLLQDRELSRVGSIKKIPIDVRVIAATNKKIRDLVLKERFRDDLYYHLNVAPIMVPPLRERPEDILPLIQHFLHIYNEEYSENKTISSSALSTMLKYQWPGNVQELQNIIERIILTTPDRVVTPSHLPMYLQEEARTNTNIYTDMSLQAAMERAEKEVLMDALENYKSTRAMAKVLQVSQPTIVRKLNKYGLSTQDS